VRDYITNHFSVTPGKFGIGKDMKARLGDFAEWLEEFNPSKSTLELPGQYSTCEVFDKNDVVSIVLASN
jgi:hypothetical protein